MNLCRKLCGVPLSGITNLSINHHLLNCQLINFASPHRYVRSLNRHRGVKREDEFSGLSEEDRSNLLETAENFEAMHSLISKSKQSPNLSHEIARNGKQFNQWLTGKIIERKYFKKEQELNLLTYDAKEQIRYLHAEDPMEWTPEALSKSFPVSVDGVKKLLKSKCKLRSIDEVVKHDKRVVKHWQLLRSGQKNEIVSRYLTYMESKSENELGGLNKYLPIPKKLTKDIVFEKTNNEKNDNKMQGKFESMVTLHLQLKSKSINGNNNNSNSNVNREKARLQITSNSNERNKIK
ncbi:hypothetical protein HELRODRAFT_172364 [Helobdella robusta]|uniref:Uncharacterized protein n=1 Tax=Helobdella robusta TaxID=6412 RepID=T1F584_HELRO|nr:hypothetical protein HELRODRAFT_172364 [Helobdella robusta]ESO04694.1 hypothetical protein HELRODRAFT_172364 [Helobdella robusta]